MIKSRLAAVLVLAVALLGATVLPAAAAGQAWQMQPSGKSGPSTRPHHVYDLAPGAVVKDYVRIENLGSKTLTLRLYATDAFSTGSGQFALLPSAEKPTDVGTWVTMSADEVTVKAGKDVIVPFEVVVPDNAAPGDHVGAVISSLVTEQTNSKGEKVLVESRIGSRIYLRVQGAVSQQLQVDSLQLGWSGSFWSPWDGRLTVSYDVTNTGNVRVTATPQVTVTGPLGLQLGRSAGPALPELLPGSTVRISSDAEAGEAIPGPELTSVFAAGFLRTTLALRADTTIVATSTAGLTAIPWLLVIVAAVIIAGAVLWWWRRRNREDRIEALVAERVAAERQEQQGSEKGAGVPPVNPVRHLLSWLMAGLVVVGLVSLGPVLPAGAAAPSVTLATATPAVGDWLAVDVSGFSPGPVQLELCSTERTGSSTAACDLAGAGQAPVGEDGRGSGLIQVSQPPAPCPCLVVARSLGTGESAEAPIELGEGGAATTTPPVAGSDDEVAAAVEGQLALAARFSRPQGVGAVLGRFFGWETRLVVEVGTANRGDHTVGAQSTEIWASSADRPTPRQVGQLDLAALPAGDRGSVQTEIVLPGPVLTATTIWLRPYGVGPSQTLTTVVADRSWGLIALAVVLLALAVVLAGRIGYGLVSAVVNRKQPVRAPRRTGWRPSLVGVAAALAVVAAAVLVQGVSEDQAAAAHWTGRRADAIIAAGARPATPTIAVPTADGAAHWRIQEGMGPAALTAGVGRWPGAGGASLLVGIGDQPDAPFARLDDRRPGEVVVLTATDGTTTTYKITSVRPSPTGAPILPGEEGELILWAVASTPDAGADTVVRAEVVR